MKKLDVKLLRRWIKWLRSGQYEQGSGALVSRDGTAFCCLGVLADIQGAEWKEMKNGYLTPYLPGDKKSMACAVYKDDDSHQTRGDSHYYIHPKFAGGLLPSQLSQLAGDNDIGKSFHQIAERIEGYITANKKKK